MAKTVNFGVIYGLSAYGLSTRLGITQSEAAAFIEAYFAKYPGVTSFIRRTLEEAKARGRVETILGRRRTVTGVRNTERMTSQPERVAVNAVIQGSAADMIKKAMLAVDRELKRRDLKARMLLQIHDELVFEAPDEELPELAELVRTAMTTALPLDVPLKVDVAAGPNWLDVAPL
jgi:DNA polymerase-1